MRFDRDTLLLYAVTDRSWLKGRRLAEQVEEALRGGVTLVQLREKELEETAFEEEAREILSLCHWYNVPLLINDNVELAMRVGADGVHVGQSDMESGRVRELLGPDKIIGVTAKTIEQARRAQAAGADYLGSGAVFGTTTKLDARAMDLEQFTAICSCVDIPVVAIGGVNAGNAARLAGTGAAGIAVVGGIFAQPDVKAAARELKEIAGRALRLHPN